MSEQAPKEQGGSEDSTSTSSAAKFRLNPSAMEFVPKFANPVAPPQQSYQPSPHHYYGHNNSNNHRHSNNPRHHHPNHHHNSNHHAQYNNYSQPMYKNNNSSNCANQNDIDPIEMEARCEAVVEILQDERVRGMVAGLDAEQPGEPSQPNQQPSVQQLSQQMSNDLNLNQPDQSGEPDEDDLLEMMAMQDECRMEMMKFYIQSQNPELFSEIYHDVSYPDQPVKPGEQPAGAAANPAPQAADK